MLYPLKFTPLYKDYIWGGRNLERYGKHLPPGIVAESWEISCHKDGISTVSEGEYKGVELSFLVEKFGRELMGHALDIKDVKKFPLLVKLIDACNDLSVQVHPCDEYAFTHENGEYGKNEMWYIISAEPGANLIYDLIPGTSRESLDKAIKNNTVEQYLKKIPVAEGDIINIPSGLIHAIGKGIILCEIQQNSNTTYRIYDYNRTDDKGNKRPLHIKKALDVIDFDSKERKEKYRGLELVIGEGITKTFLAACKYFAAELVSINGEINEFADGSRFYIYTFIKGTGSISTVNESYRVTSGESVLIPATLGAYSISGNLKAIKSYLPGKREDLIKPLVTYGYSIEDIHSGIAGIKEYL